MKYVIWGCGKRGKALSILLGKDTVRAFIDNNRKLEGTFFLDIPVISYKEYMLNNSHEIVIIAVKGAERSIGEILDKDKKPWIAIDSIEYISILNQIRLGFNSILERTDTDGINIIYGFNVYGVYLYELLKNHNRTPYFFIENCKSEMLSKTIEEEFPVLSKNMLENKTVKCFFAVESDYNEKWVNNICKQLIEIHKIYKEYKIFCNAELKKFHNMHRGKRCFVIANGPSLRMSDLDLLRTHGEICMGVNGIFKAFDMTKWRPDYYFICDIFGVLQWKEAILHMDVGEKFIADTGWFFEDEEVTKNMHRFHSYMEYCADRLPQFTNDYSMYSYWGGSVIYDGPLQMAMYMGFEEIYMLGADCTIEESQEKQHFIKNYEDDKFSKSYGLDLKQVFKGYESARKYAEQHNVRMFNATRGGNLEILERVDFDSLFN